MPTSSPRPCMACGSLPDTADRYCAACGEHLHVPPLRLRTVVGQALQTVTSMDRGFLFNLKALTLAPRKLVAQYLAGQRRRIYNPLAYALVMTTLYLLTDALFYDPAPTEERVRSGFNELSYEAGRFIGGNFKYVWLSGILWLGLATRLLFARFSLAEHLAIGGFLIGQVTFIGFLGVIIVKIPLVFNPAVYLALALLLGVLFVERRRVVLTIAKVLVVMLLFLTQLLLLAFAVVLGMRAFGG